MLILFHFTSFYQYPSIYSRVGKPGWLPPIGQKKWVSIHWPGPPRVGPLLTKKCKKKKETSCGSGGSTRLTHPKIWKKNKKEKRVGGPTRGLTHFQPVLMRAKTNCVLKIPTWSAFWWVQPPNRAQPKLSSLVHFKHGYGYTNPTNILFIFISSNMQKEDKKIKPKHWLNWQERGVSMIQYHQPHRNNHHPCHYIRRWRHREN